MTFPELFRITVQDLYLPTGRQRPSGTKPPPFRNILHHDRHIPEGMRRIVPLLVILACIGAAILGAGCTSSSPSTRPKATTTTLGPVMTTPVVPVFTTPGFTGAAGDVGPAATGREPANSSGDASEGMHNTCPAYQPFRCPDGYCAHTSAECPMSPRVGNCSDGTINCP